MVLEKTLENPLDCKEIQSVHPKGNQSWIFIGRMGAKAETPILRPPDEKKLTYWKRPFWERLTAGGEGDDRAWDGWMASPTEWIWVWVNSGSWWWTGRPGVHGVAESDTTEWLNWTELNWTECYFSTRAHRKIEKESKKKKKESRPKSLRMIQITPLGFCSMRTVPAERQREGSQMYLLVTQRQVGCINKHIRQRWGLLL